MSCKHNNILHETRLLGGPKAERRRKNVETYLEIEDSRNREVSLVLVGRDFTKKPEKGCCGRELAGGS